jgi:hypothetical protein
MQAVDTSQEETLISQEAASYGDYARKGAFHGIARDLLGFAISNWKVASARRSPAVNVPTPGPCRGGRGKTENVLKSHSGHTAQTSPFTSTEPHRTGFAEMDEKRRHPHSGVQQHSISEMRGFAVSSGKAEPTDGSLAPRDLVSAMPTNRERLVAATAQAREVCND